MQYAAGGTALGMVGNTVFGAASASDVSSDSVSGRLPREVWIASIQGSAPGDTHQEKVKNFIRRMELIVPFKPDIICLPEVCPFDGLPGGRPPVPEIAEVPIGPVCKPFAEFAAKHRCYVFCPTYTRDDGHFYNALVLIDRNGEVVGEYRKMHPTVGEMTSEISPGSLEPPVFHTDFGTIGAQICFDIEWDDGWQAMNEKGAEIVFWSSAFGGGQALNARAQVHKYCVVSSTRKGDSKIIDITGRDIAWTGRWKNWVCAPVNLERAFLHTWPFVRRFGEIDAKYGSAIRITTCHEEEWSIIESLSPELRVAEVMEEFELKTFQEHIGEADAMQKERRP